MKNSCNRLVSVYSQLQGNKCSDVAKKSNFKKQASLSFNEFKKS